VNITAAQQAANAIDLAIRAGGVQAALAHIELLSEIAQAVADAKAAQPEKDES